MTSLGIDTARLDLNVGAIGANPSRDDSADIAPFVPANLATVPDPFIESFILKLLPDSYVVMQLAKLFDDKPLHLEALGEALSADRARSFLIRSIRGGERVISAINPALPSAFF